MSRYVGEKDSKPVLDAAAHWRDSALIRCGSVFTDDGLWTKEMLDSLDRHFVRSPDMGEGVFLEKLERQLAQAPDNAKRLASEMLWLMYLCPSSLTSTHKRQTIETIWAWSGDRPPTNSRWLGDSVLSGIGSAGPGFNQNQWRELVFCIQFTRMFQALSPEDQQRLLGDGWAFDEWLKEVPDWHARQLRHMLLYLLFPDDFERIFGQTDRKQIVRHFSTKVNSEINRMDPVELDRELKAIRARLEQEHGTSDLDYYVEPLRSVWKVEGAPTVPGADDSTDSIRQLLVAFQAQAASGSRLGVADYLREYRGLSVKVSFGKGNFARIPWVAFLGADQQVSRGIYPVILLFREEGVLLLCYGVSEENQPSHSWTELGDSETVQHWFRRRFGRDPDRYGASYVHSAYDLRSPLPTRAIKDDLDKMIEVYAELLSTIVDGNGSQGARQDKLPVTIDLDAAVQDFASALTDSYVHFGARHNEVVTAFIASLVTKPLVILTGLSGSGKTQIAVRFGEWLGSGRLHVAAVRPDWTGSEALFGFEDGLKPAVGGRAAWNVPPALEFMLAAASDVENPYLILLDEMNLAHVERYFADVLSGMESGQPCLPNLQLGRDGHWRHREGGAPRISFPRNLWVVGTVNVDETTYMFSPKVLDRANTFEFRVDTGDLLADARKPRRCSPGSPDLVRGLLNISNDDEWHLSHPATYREDLEAPLRLLHELLSRYNLEFGHRVFHEAIRFSAIANGAGFDTMEAVLDRIVMQKVLPRLHGSRRRLEVPLLALAQYSRDLPNSIDVDEKLASFGTDQSSQSAAKLPDSHAKVIRMLRNLRANQFVSFAE